MKRFQKTLHGKCVPVLFDDHRSEADQGTFEWELCEVCWPLRVVPQDRKNAARYFLETLQCKRFESCHAAVGCR